MAPQGPEDSGLIRNGQKDGGTTLLLHERLLLLVLDDEKGTSRSSYAEPGLAGALVLDLVRMGSVEIADQHLPVMPGLETPAGVLAEATIAIVDKPRSPRWVDHLPGRGTRPRPRNRGE